MAGINVAKLITELRLHLGVDSTDTDWTDTDCVLCLNRPFWEFFSERDLNEASKQTTFSTVAGTFSYALSAAATGTSADNFEAVRQLSIEDLNSYEHQKLHRLTEEDYQDGKFVNTIDSRGIPEAYLRRGNALIIYPTPDVAYTMVLDYWVTDADLAAAGTVALVNAYHQAILYGAIAIGKERLGDLDGASYYKKEFRNYKNSIKPPKAKEEEDSRYAALDVRLNRYD